MHQSNPTDDVVRTVIRRTELLAALADQPQYKRDLVETLACSRSTIDRAIRELESLEFIARTETGYQLTAGGRLALSEYRRVEQAFTAIEESGSLLRHVPAGAPLSTTLLDDARTYEVKPHAPIEPLQELVSRFETATRVRGFAAAERIPATRMRLYERTVEEDLTVEAIFTEDLAEFLFAEYPEQVRSSATEGAFDMYAIESIPYELTLIEQSDVQYVFVFVLNERTEIEGVISNNTQAAFEWGESVFREVRSAARSVSPPE